MHAISLADFFIIFESFTGPDMHSVHAYLLLFSFSSSTFLYVFQQDFRGCLNSFANIVCNFLFVLECIITLCTSSILMCYSNLHALALMISMTVESQNL